MLGAKCRGCENTDLRQIMDFGEMPLAGGFLANRGSIASEERFPLAVHVCCKCSLVQIVDAIDPDVLFRDYSFSSSTIGALVTHFERYASWLKERYRPSSIVEIGCNDGVLLAPLEKMAIRACGVDISENITKIARDRGLDVVTGYFDRRVAEQIRERLGPADIVTGSNCFPHNATPAVILDAARIALKPTGHLALELMYAGDLLTQMQWDTLYHEHLTFYSLETLSILLARHGFYAVHAERLPMHGGSLRVVAARTPGEPSPQMREIQQFEESIKLNHHATWLDFGGRCRRKIEIVRDVLGALHKTGARIWGYGAAGKATMWVNACNMTYLGGMVDASPLRAGKLMPGTHTEIVFPEQLRKAAPDYIFLTAWNYAEGIVAKEAWFRGTWLIPLPELRFF
jgi:novobiocin biosynthesis protein NovU/D-mycarose 3-C-methyltransferase